MEHAYSCNDFIHSTEDQSINCDNFFLVSDKPAYNKVVEELGDRKGTWMHAITLSGYIVLWHHCLYESLDIQVHNTIVLHTIVERLRNCPEVWIAYASSLLDDFGVEILIVG